jgi:methionyl-tRNA formyltransferase
VSDHSSPAGQPEDDELLALAHHAGIPVLAMPSLRHERAVAAIAQCSPDLIVASCFPLYVPRAVRNLARLGCLNVHPSLLPRWRGPEPVFWALRAGDDVTGVTIHLMSAGWDTGPILAQEPVSWPEGARLPEIERMLSERGAELLLTAIEGLVSGTTVPTPQDASGATYAPFPQPEDSIISTAWDARHAFRFARAIAPLFPVIGVHIISTNERLHVAGAISWSPGAANVPVQQRGDMVTVAFTAGVVQFRASEPPAR